MFNQINLTGNLGKDFEVRKISNDKSYAISSACVMLNARRLENGDWSNEQLWLGLRADGFLAAKAGKTMKKGAHVMISGKLRNFQSDDEEWEAGEAGYLYVQLESIELIGKLPESENPELAKKSSKPRKGLVDM